MIRRGFNTTLYLIFLFLSTSASAQVTDATAAREHIFPLFIDGDDTQSFILLSNLSAGANQCSLQLQGEGLDTTRIEANQYLTSSGARASIVLHEASASLILMTKGAGELALGYARLECAEPVVARVLLVTKTNSQVSSMATMESAQSGNSFQFPLASRLGSLDLYIANDLRTASDCSIELRGSQRQSLGNQNFSSPSLSTTVQSIEELFSLPAGFDVGSVELSCNSNVTAVGLPRTGSVYTALPAISLQEDTNASVSHIVPLVADGEGFRSQLFVTNLAEFANQCTVAFFGFDLSAGRFESLQSLTSLGSETSLALNGIGDQLSWLSTGTASLGFGYAKLDCEASVVTANLLTVGARDELTGMAIIPTVQLAREFQIPIIALANRLALVINNLSESLASCIVELAEAESSILLSGSIQLPKQSIAVRFLSDLFDLPDDFSNGIISFNCDSDVSAVSIPLNGVSFTAIPPVILAPPANPSMPDLITITGNPNQRDPSTGRTALHIAAMANANGLIRVLVNAGSHLNNRDNAGLTPLHLAVLANAPEAVETLLALGADRDVRTVQQQSLLQFAVALGRPYDALIGAVPDTIKFLLDTGSDPNEASGENLSCYTPLHWSANFSHTISGKKVLSMLLDAGADPNVVDCSLGWTPLGIVVRFGNDPASVAALLSAGADPNVRIGSNSETVVHVWARTTGDISVTGSHVPALTHLLNAGLTIDARDVQGRTPLHYASEWDLSVNVRALLDAGADPNARDENGRTPLHAAASSAVLSKPAVSTAAMVALLENGADPNIPDNAGLTAVELVAPDSLEVVNVLLATHAGKRSENPDAQDIFGHTALHAAARANSPGFISTLIDLGANPEIRDEEGNTALFLASGAFPRRGGRNNPPPTQNPEAIFSLIHSGASIDTTDRYGNNIWRYTEMGTLGSDSDNLTIIGILAEFESTRKNASHGDFMTLLAVAANNPENLSSVIQSGISPDELGPDGSSILHWIVSWEESAAVHVIEILADAGAQMNTVSNWSTALGAAAYQNKPLTVAALLAAEANPNVFGPRGYTALHHSVTSPFGDVGAIVTLLADNGANIDAGTLNLGHTPLHLAVERGNLSAISALLKAGADINAKNFRGQTALQLAVLKTDPWRNSNLVSIAMLAEAGANINEVDDKSNTPIRTALIAGQKSAAQLLRTLGAKWDIASRHTNLNMNARIVQVQMFQGPMVWQWEESDLMSVGESSPISLSKGVSYSKTILGRGATISVRIGSELPEPTPELSVSLSDADGRLWTASARRVQGPTIDLLPEESTSGLWETEYVYELPADWVKAANYATIEIDPENLLDEMNEDDNLATLVIDGFDLPQFNMTFVPVVFSENPNDLGANIPSIDIDTYMSILGDLLPIGEYQAKIGKTLDLSGRGLGIRNINQSKLTALEELLHRWNTEANANEYYHGLLFPDEISFTGFGGQAYAPGNVSVSNAIHGSCQIGIQECRAVQPHEIGHNFGLDHAPGNCNETEPIDQDFPYARAGIGPRRGWVSTRDDFATSGGSTSYFDLMSYCTPQFVSDYNYNKMTDHRLSFSSTPPNLTEDRSPRIEIGRVSTAVSLVTSDSIWHDSRATTTTVSEKTTLVHAAKSETSNLSLAITGVMDKNGIWSILNVDPSAQPPRLQSVDGNYILTLSDINNRESYRVPISLMTIAHGEARQVWAVRVPMPDVSQVIVSIHAAEGVPLFSEEIEVPQ